MYWLRLLGAALLLLLAAASGRLQPALEAQPAAPELPPRATWRGAPDGYPDGVPPLLASAWDTAAAFAGVSRDQVYFSDVFRADWGTVYEFVFPPNVDEVCGVLVPQLEVWSAPLPVPWRSPRQRGGVDTASARTIGEDFVRDYLGHDLSTCVFRDETGDQPEPRVYRLAWTPVRDGVMLPSFTKVDVDAEDGAVRWFADARVPLSLSTESRVDDTQAIATAREFLASLAKDGQEQRRLKGAPVVSVSRKIDYWAPRHAQGKRQQTYIVQVALRCEVGTDTGGADETPVRYIVSIDGKTGRVLEHFSLMEPPARDVPLPALPVFPGEEQLADEDRTWRDLPWPAPRQALETLLAPRWHPPDEAAAAWFRTWEDGPQQVTVSWVVEQVRLVAWVNVSDRRRTVMLRARSERTEPPLDWRPPLDERAVLSEALAHVINLPALAAPDPSDALPPWAVGQSDQPRFRLTKLRRETGTDMPAGVYQTNAGNYTIQAWLDPSPRPQLHLVSIR